MKICVKIFAITALILVSFEAVSCKGFLAKMTKKISGGHGSSDDEKDNFAVLQKYIGKSAEDIVDGFANRADREAFVKLVKKRKEPNLVAAVDLIKKYADREDAILQRENLSRHDEQGKFAALNYKYQQKQVELGEKLTNLKLGTDQSEAVKTEIAKDEKELDDLYDDKKAILRLHQFAPSEK